VTASSETVILRLKIPILVITQSGIGARRERETEKISREHSTHLDCRAGDGLVYEGSGSVDHLAREGLIVQIYPDSVTVL
jgi:hypothetical protein